MVMKATGGPPLLHLVSGAENVEGKNQADQELGACGDHDEEAQNQRNEARDAQM